MSTASLTMEQRIWRCSVGPARAGLPKLLDSVLHGWLGARGAPTSAGRSWAGTQCNQFKESAIKSSGAGRKVWEVWEGVLVSCVQVSDPKDDRLWFPQSARSETQEVFHL